MKKYKQRSETIPETANFKSLLRRVASYSKKGDCRLKMLGATLSLS